MHQYSPINGHACACNSQFIGLFEDRAPLVFQKSINKSPELCSVRFCKNRRRKNSTICSKHLMQKWRNDNPISAIYRIIKDRAKRKNIDFSLTLPEFLDFCNRTGYLKMKGVHIDRIDPTEGYHLWNIQAINGIENVIKGNKERYSPRYQEYLAKRKAGLYARQQQPADEEGGFETEPEMAMAGEIDDNTPF